MLKPDARKSIQFIRSSSIRTMSIARADMRGVVRDVDWPPKLSNVEFVDCRFSPDSLVTVLNSISPDVKHPIALSLDGVALGAREYQEFCRRSDTILELSHMIKLSWARNRIDGAWEQEFMRIFVMNNLRFLDISQCIKQSEVIVLDRPATSRLWGLAVRGAPEGGECSLRDQMQALLPRFRSRMHRDEPNEVGRPVCVSQDRAAHLVPLDSPSTTSAIPQKSSG
jgi:hypothetical protein